MLWGSVYHNGYVRYKLLGMRIFKRKTDLLDIEKKYEDAKGLNLLALDREIASIADIVYSKKISDFQQAAEASSQKQKIAFLATRLMDWGGHTEYIKSMIDLLSMEYGTALFLLNRKDSLRQAPVKMKAISQKSQILGLRSFNGDFAESLTALYNQIAAFNPRVLFLCYHMDDILSAALSYLLRQHTKIRQIYFNHGSHVKALGLSFCDLIIEGMPMAHYVTQKYRGLNKGCVIGLPALKKDDTKYFSEEEKAAFRHRLGIGANDFLTISGGTGYKFFDKNGSEYFKMIKNIMLEEPRLRHLLISRFSRKEMACIEALFADAPEARNRLLFIDFTPNFDIVCQSCDFFIDSFPVSAALTQVDMMRNRRPTIVKINRENSLLSFHEYLPPDYPYMYDNQQDMSDGIIKLLHDKNDQKKMVEILYEHYLNNFEGSVTHFKYRDLIENAHDLQRFCQPFKKEAEYNFIGLD